MKTTDLPCWVLIIITLCHKPLCLRGSSVVPASFLRLNMDTCPSSPKLPVWFLSHGPGPAWLLPPGDMGASFKVSQNSPSAKVLQTLLHNHPFQASVKPRAILVVSAHWEEKEHTMSTNPMSELLFDYYGFPEEAYKIKWTPPGAPAEVLKRTRDLLEKAGIPCMENGKRGLDHGVFVPLKLVFPNADVPIFEVSLKSNMNIADHLKLGEALAPLRQEGVLIVGSGHTTHSMGSLSGPPETWAVKFQEWIHNVLTNSSISAQERKAKLLASNVQETFCKAHPRIEHYLPLVVMAAAGGYNKGELMYDEFIMGSLLCSHVKFS